MKCWLGFQLGEALWVRIILKNQLKNVYFIFNFIFPYLKLSIYEESYTSSVSSSFGGTKQKENVILLYPGIWSVNSPMGPVLIYFIYKIK